MNKKQTRPINDTEWGLVTKWYQENTWADKSWNKTDQENLDAYRENAFVFPNYCDDGPGYVGPVIFMIGGFVNYIIAWTLVIPERDGEAYLERIKTEFEY